MIPSDPQNSERTATPPLAPVVPPEEPALLPVTPPEEQALLAMNVATLIDHLEQKHHAFTRDVLARIEAQLPPIIAAHGVRLPVLLEIARTFDELSQELAVHMQKEERILFPYLRTLEAAALAHLPLRRPAFQSALNPIRVMLQEHDAADIFLHRLRNLTGSYTPPPGEGPEVGQIYLMLASLDLDLIQHIDLENRILFPRAVPLERQTLV